VLRAFTVGIVCVLAACNDDDPARVLSDREFDVAIDQICAAHSEELEALEAEFFDDDDLSGVDTEPEVETFRRSLMDAKRALIEELHRIEPAADERAWRAAVDRYATAIDEASEGPRVDVQHDALAPTRDELIDEFGLDDCF
jgi:hypothetical protein